MRIFDDPPNSCVGRDERSYGAWYDETGGTSFQYIEIPRGVGFFQKQYVIVWWFACEAVSLRAGAAVDELG